MTSGQQYLHLLAIGLVVLAVTIIMTPAANHRQQGGREITERFIRISARLLLCSMAPLATALCLDFYIVMAIVTNECMAAFFSTLLFLLVVLVWFVFPRTESLKSLVDDRKI